MPELPEVETIKRTLEPKLTGQSFTEALIYLPTIIRIPGIEEFKKEIVGQKIKSISRRGKYLTINLSNNLALIFHLRMTGRLIYCHADEPIVKHTHLILKLDSGNELRFIDVRQFGRIWLVSVQKLNTVSGLKDLGPEPFDKKFTREFLKKELRRRRTRIKPLLLDQTFIAGLGNIYADEALHRARIHPEKLACNLTARETSKLFITIREVLEEGINNRGTTFRDYVDGNGQAGSNQELLQIYNREGQPCLKCKTTIVRIKISGRSSYFCPSCQKE
ncbi:formamidopyrimidine-DNA glycosylase [Desulfofarcimen acetoxidans DSM 771]|uniref:Formamidopyrimidine-DNA glycosylase n=1 Tax=Desulfofarcimen acetoxidans (strain ATCC 49208 / DSM 771 / KCTC 5769 / VKM B-1644 / 5575) TaxID=485916 RepID=C8W0H2_DESAS|nr:bifunctional DNA-formamidopyrimidine glycosylase/DNA-(apurinic or apyrimidinic site) lyase [Desulfofarcimen acetoxidans]ACV63227.1 formamidopyrimidine-DNA glycosylase [Desulfofarcimen acetoxidans DSM 771]